MQTSSFPRSHVVVEAMQTISPTKMTNPCLTMRVEAKGGVASSFLGRRVHVVMYYNRESNENSGYFLAGWFRESLGIAMDEEPILAGRVRCGGENEGGFEIVSNDGGVRLVEARIGKTLAEFVDVEERDEMEGDLVSWEDVGDGNPQFCPLFHVQVTNFLCGGYSVGISCSLLVADPFFVINFLKRWADIHQKLVYDTNNSKLPLFYLPDIKSKSSPLAKQTSLNTFIERGETLIFKTSVVKNLNDSELNKALALQCINEAELKRCAKRTSIFCLLVKQLNGDMTVEMVKRKSLMEMPVLELSRVNYDDLNAKEVTFCVSNKVVCVCNWINPISGSEGLVILFPFSKGNVFEINIVVALPKETVG